MATRLLARSNTLTLALNRTFVIQQSQCLRHLHSLTSPLDLGSYQPSPSFRSALRPGLVAASSSPAISSVIGSKKEYGDTAPRGALFFPNVNFGGKMNGYQNRKGQDLQKPAAGCMGRMINIFDMSTGMPRNKLLTEKPHQDAGSLIHGNRADVVKQKAMDNFGVQKEYKTITTNMWKSSSKKSCGTPMKMLIAQEMSREPQSKQNPSNVIAKLMGLESLPVRQSVLSVRRSSQDGYLHHFLSAQSRGYWEQEDSSCPNSLQLDTKVCAHKVECKDVHEVQQQPSRNTRFKDKPSPNRKRDGSPTEKRLSLVYQKFNEAKRLATDEKLLQSKEFQDALEVLNSNRDLFLKFLEEPNAILSKNLVESQTRPPASQTRRITVLKPSKVMEAKGEALERRLLRPALEGTDCVISDIGIERRTEKSSSSVQAENISQPTRIVVLKPSLGMPHELKSGLTSPVTLSNLSEHRSFDGCLGPDEVTESRDIAKEITRCMQEYVSGNQVDEILLPPALSNGYVGDESSLNGLETNYIKEECTNLSDSESVTPISRHSCDYNYRLGSPHSISSFSQAFYSPEPSVIKEAKRRLSERLAAVFSKEISQEQSQMQKTSSTLGDMLAIGVVQIEERANNLTISSRRSYGGEQDQRESTPQMEGCTQDSPMNLERSKSLPISSSVYETVELSEEVSESTINKSIIPKEAVVKSKSGMSSFKGKVASLFLSRIKKATREKPIPSCFLGLDHSEASGERNTASSGSFKHCDSEGKTENVSSSSTSLNRPKHCTPSPKAPLLLEKSRQADNSRENQDQPSPISVLEAPFQDDANSSICQPSASIISCHPQALSRSPPIGSISRTLAYDNPRDIPLENSSKPSRALSKECEEQERSTLIKKLLSSANLLDSSECSNVLARWYSLDSPLDPILLEEFLDRKTSDCYLIVSMLLSCQ
ncbi:uncharacterized protein A4U43_C07F19390 [Asparagus officinalis]|uniref:DUF3741 domain-containing protein n=1 Tax=Asparagus officinalis TaxID=4686 RepID=A0A5P1EGL3_ASPOF|nr:uncharacterized protein A4U43_C07F19390 [Asparagus officinalis]